MNWKLIKIIYRKNINIIIDATAGILGLGKPVKYHICMVIGLKKKKSKKKIKLHHKKNDFFLILQSTFRVTFVENYLLINF